MESGIEAQRIFELYVDQLQGEAETLDELLLVRLRWFSEDISMTAERLLTDPAAAVSLVQHLSTLMQELDAQAGATAQARETILSAKKWALLLPETAIHNGGGESETKDETERSKERR